VKAAPNAKCDLAFAPPANGAKVALGAKSAPASGALAWSWTVPGGAKPGLGKVTLTCNGLSVSKEIKIG
jgi:hypothetical protein